MKIRKRLFLISLMCSVSIISCSKDGKESDSTGDRNLDGVLLYDSGEQTYKLDLRSNTRSLYFNRNNYSLNGWDVSWDGTIRLETSSVSGEFGNVRFKLVNPESNTIVKEFVYNNPNGEDRALSGLLSPDKSLILIQPDFNHGIVIIDMEGNVKHHLPIVNDTELTLGDKVIWLPDNSILFTFEKYILKSAPPYTAITPIKEMDYADWGNLHVNRDASKISLRIGKHIYLMNADGTELVQVTESDREEREAVFSPDGRYLLVAANYYPGTFHSGTWDLNIIRADGNKYKVGNNPGTGVVVVQPDGANNVEKARETMLWR